MKDESQESGGIRLQEPVGEVVTRFAPNPNGPPTIGSARGMVVNAELAKKYDGTFIVRFDDTDPATKRPLLEAYEWYIEDFAWLGITPDRVLSASDKIEVYYEHAERLIEMNAAYVCFCEQEEFRRLKHAKISCPHRETPVQDNMRLWKEMLAGKYEDGEVVLRIKTDVQHADPALRDWVAFRIIKAEHPKVGRKFAVWPMLDFESAIEDHEQGMTYIVRGKDLIDSRRRQEFVYNYFGWTYPNTIHWGRVKLSDYGKLSTSGISDSILEGKYSGWDDVRLPTLRALRRRGIQPEAIYNSMVSLGIGEADIALSMENIYAENRKVVDKRANRYFFIKEPVPMRIENAQDVVAKIKLHPTFKDRGMRELPVKAKDGVAEIFVSREDLPNLSRGEDVRLMNLFNVRIDEVGAGSVTATNLDEKNFKVPKLNWLQESVPAQVLMPDGTTVEGLAEPSCAALDVDDVIQFERFGFCRLDAKDDGLLFCYGHR